MNPLTSEREEGGGEGGGNNPLTPMWSLTPPPCPCLSLRCGVLYAPPHTPATCPLRPSWSVEDKVIQIATACPYTLQPLSPCLPPPPSPPPACYCLPGCSLECAPGC